MKPNADDQPMREKIWRREPNPAEQAELRAWLAAHPESATDLETEKNLTGLLARLPDAPVPSNFTARVSQAVEQEARRAERSRSSRQWWLRVVLPRTAVAAVVLTLGYFGYRQYESAARVELVKGLEEITSVASVPSPEALEDFEAIRRLTPAPDQELLALMQ